MCRSNNNNNIFSNLPMSFLVAFPRSGSNFLQNVLRKSSGYNAQSIYAPINKQDKLINLKSHAPTRAYLYDETRRLLGINSEISKKIILIRDPRDVMISFYEYTKFQKHDSFSQEFFCNQYDYFLAAPIDRNCKRREERSPLTVICAYRKHLNEWIIHTSAGSNELVVRYESLLEDSGGTFAKIFEFLCLECTLDSNSLDEKISLYSNETRERGTIEGWKHLFSDYQSIIAAVEDNLKNEISALGY